MLKILSNLHLKLQPYTPSLKLKKSPQKAFLKYIEEQHPGNSPLRYTEKKYQSHRFISTWNKLLLYHLASAAFIAPSLCYLIGKSFFRKKSEPKNHIYFSKLIPIELIDTQARLVRREFSLSPRELFFILKSFKLKALRPYFFLRIIWKSGLYFSALKKYSPKKIYCAEEMNFESPFLSLICHKYEALHCNIMHGDKPFYIKDSFILFDEFYVWLPEFQTLFEEMSAHVKAYKLFNPIPLKYKTPQTSKPILKYYAQYSSTSEEFEQRLLNGLNFAKRRRLSFVFRPHPRHFTPTDLQIVNKHNISIEPFSISILDSIAEAQIVCAEWSSVLLQAKFMSKEIVIDNTNPHNIKKLNELDFTVLKNPNLTYLLP